MRCTDQFRVDGVAWVSPRTENIPSSICPRIQARPQIIGWHVLRSQIQHFSNIWIYARTNRSIGYAISLWTLYYKMIAGNEIRYPSFLRAIHPPISRSFTPPLPFAMISVPVTLGDTIGAAFLGCIAASMCVMLPSMSLWMLTIYVTWSLYGISNLQVFVYYQSYPNDWRFQKYAVRAVLSISHVVEFLWINYLRLGCFSLVSPFKNHKCFAKFLINRLMDTFHLALTIHAVYHYAIGSFGDFSAQAILFWLVPSHSNSCFPNFSHCGRSFKVSPSNTNQAVFHFLSLFVVSCR